MSSWPRRAVTLGLVKWETPRPWWDRGLQGQARTGLPSQTKDQCRALGLFQGVLGRTVGVPELLLEWALGPGGADSHVPSRPWRLTPSLWMEEPFMRQGRSTA